MGIFLSFIFLINTYEVFLYLLKTINLPYLSLHLSVAVHLSGFSSIVLIFGSKLLWGNHTFLLTRFGWMKRRMAMEFVSIRVVSLPLRRPSWPLDSIGSPCYLLPKHPLVFQRTYIFLLRWFINSKMRVLHMIIHYCVHSFIAASLPYKELHE